MSYVAHAYDLPHPSNSCLSGAVFPQDHYDWGLRAIKSVLVVAGSLKRGDPDRPEDQVLMRSLRDFNIPKIVTDDMPVFMGLIGDLFPALDVPRKRDLDFEAVVRKAIVDLKLQAEDNFVLKVCEAFPDKPSLSLNSFLGPHTILHPSFQWNFRCTDIYPIRNSSIYLVL